MATPQGELRARRADPRAADSQPVVDADEGSTPQPGLLERLKWLVCAVLYVFCVVSGWQIMHARRGATWSVASASYLLVALANALNCAANLVGVAAYRPVNSVLQSVLVPVTLTIPFDFAARFQSLFQVRSDAVLVFIAVLIGLSLFQVFQSASADFQAYSFQFNVVAEILVTFVCLGLSLVLWSHDELTMLLVGTVAFTTTLVFPDLPTELGRAIFCLALLFTEHELSAKAFHDWVPNRVPTA